MKTVHLAGLAFEVEDDNLVIRDSDGEDLGWTTVADALIRVPEIAAVLRYATIQEDE